MENVLYLNYPKHLTNLLAELRVLIGSTPTARANQEKIIMKIAILSLVPGRNYGGILQSYALKTILERLGHEVQVISRERSHNIKYYISHIPHFVLRTIRKIMGRNKLPIVPEYAEDKANRILYRDMLAFCKKNLNLRIVSKLCDIKPTEYDIFVVGSDQVWRPRYFEYQYLADISNAYLSFSHSWNVKRIAYAPSFGVDNWEYTSVQTSECTKLLSRFKAVSVREVSGIELCRKFLGRDDAVQVCDPTLLLTRRDYEQLISSQQKAINGHLLVYCLDNSEELSLMVNRISKEKQIEPYYINSKSTNNELQAKPSVESWLQAFRDAEFVITDSFHACVFSLIFKKEFLVFGNETRGMSRFETLLNEFGQISRLIYKSSDYKKNVYPSLDTLDGVIEQLRARSFKFIEEALS